MTTVEVVRNVGSSAAQSLEREVWRFWYDDRFHALILDQYRHETRRSLRCKKWDVQREYERLGHRRGAPELPGDVEDEARYQFAESLRCLNVTPKWN